MQVWWQCEKCYVLKPMVVSKSNEECWCCFLFLFLKFKNLLSENLFRTDFSKVWSLFKFQLSMQFNNYINIHALVCLLEMIVGLKLHNFSLNISPKFAVQLEPDLVSSYIMGTTIWYWWQRSNVQVKGHLMSSCKIGWNVGNSIIIELSLGFSLISSCQIYQSWH